VDIATAVYHECGHVVMSYYYGFSCDSIQISLSERDSKTVIKYGEVQSLVEAILRYNEEPAVYAETSRHHSQENIFSTLVKLGVILASGGIAERVYLNKLNPEAENDEVLPSGSDLARLQSIHSIFQALRPGFPSDYLDKLFQVWHVTIRDQIWPAIDGLARAVLETADLSMGQAEIEHCLENYKMILFQDTLLNRAWR